MPEERLQKVLAHAGIASRRRAEELITAGRVTVNGEVVKELGVKVNPRRDVVHVDGRQVGKPEQHVYFLLHKPRGVLSAAGDARGRRTVVDLVPSGARLYPVGRLDLESEGLILLTNDGELAYRLAHPRYEHEKEYRVLVEGRPAPEALDRLRKGVGMEGGWTLPAQVQVEREADSNTWLRIVLKEGRKRQIRRMVEAVGYRVLRLIRVRIGPLHLSDLKPGASRPLTAGELRAIKVIRAEEPKPWVGSRRRGARPGGPGGGAPEPAGRAPGPAGRRPRAGTPGAAGGARRAPARPRTVGQRPREKRGE